MRVALISGEYPPDRGGVADYTRLLALALAAEGVAVDVLAPRRVSGLVTGASRTLWRGNGQRTKAPPAPRSAAEIRVSEFHVAGVWGWSLARALSRLVARTRPDVLHIQYQTAAYGMHPGVNVAPWWMRRTHLPARIAFTYHDLRVPYLFPRAGWLRRYVTLLPARWSHLTIATNEADYIELAEAGRAWRLELIPIGSNVPDRPPADYDRAAWRAAAGLAPTDRLVAYFGMLNESKGVGCLIEALAQLVASGRSVRGVLIGELVGTSDPTNREGWAAIERQLQRLDLGQRIIRTGYLPPESVSAWLHASDVVALPYRDGWSYRRGSLLAALEHGCPIVTTQAPPLRSGVAAALPPLQDGESALLVRADDEVALADALCRLIDAPALAATIAVGARRLAQHFAWPGIARRHIALYEEVLAGS